jgi:adenylate cyclase
MGVEIERKFLIDLQLLPSLPNGIQIHQGYLGAGVRVRLAKHPDGSERAELTVKGEGVLVRPEYNYTIPPKDAAEILKLSYSSLRKIRTLVDVEKHTWEIDQYLGPLKGLWTAEVELDSMDDVVKIPKWATKEVTYDRKYANSNLARYGLPKST